MNYAFIDFEYLETQDKTTRKIICACILITDFNEINIRLTSDLTNNKGLYNFQQNLETLNLDNTIFIGYAIAGAEVPCLVQTMGVEWVNRTKWIDLWVEFKMWALTHSDFYDYKTKSSLADCIKCFDIEDRYSADKDETRDLIIYDKENRKSKALTRLQADTFYFMPDEMTQITEYCFEDVKILVDVAYKLADVGATNGIEITESERLARGDFCKYSGISYALGKGFPMDIDKTKAVFSNREEIKRVIQSECNSKIGYEIYRPIYKGRNPNKVLVGYSFTHSVFEEYIESVGLADIWEKTEKGIHLRLDDEYFDQMLSNNKDILIHLYNARNTLKQLNSTNLAEIMSEDGYIKCPPFPFHQKTSRSSPKPKLGFILNLSPWLRMLIRPPEGRAFVGIDFKSQEILIAACLAKDPLMLQGYLKDFYMDTAIQTGFAPEGATKQTHPHIRGPFKPISLAVLYGQWIKSLAYKFMHLNKEWDYDEALDEAKRFMDNHKDSYHKYWSFVEDTFNESKDSGYYKGPGPSGWYYFVDDETRTTQLQNVPCQKAGAEMMRIAHDKCVKARIWVLPLHDALYFECDERDAVSQAKVVSRYMCEASFELLGHDYMSTETTIFTSNSPYYDARGEDTYKLVMNKLGFEIPENFVKPREILDIHKEI